MNVFILVHDQENSFYSGKTYTFFSAKRENKVWPIEDGAFLGPVGAWNALTRAGYNPSFCSIDELKKPNEGDLLIIHAVGEFTQNHLNTFSSWLSAKGKIIGCGDINSYQSLLPNCLLEKKRSISPYSGLGYRVSDTNIEVIAPRQWSYGSASKKDDKVDTEFGPDLVRISGAFNTPSLASLENLPQAPSWIKQNGFVYFNANPFSAFQAWLQGQEDLNPWLNWRNEMNWLDLHAAFLVSHIIKNACDLKKTPKKNIKGSPVKVIFRHDVDSSRDLSLLQETEKRNFLSTYAVLIDRNRLFWNEQLSKSKYAENAFHYSTTNDGLSSKIKHKLRLSNEISIKSAKKSIAHGGLLKQLKKAKSLGVGIETIHRHFSYFYYPEYIDAFFSLENEFPEFLGGSSYSRASIYRWGNLRIDGQISTIRSWPDPWFSYWYPFKLSDASNFGEASKGFESCSAMEFEPSHAFQLLTPSNCGHLEKVITLIYHPAHATQPTFNKSGTIDWFKEICDYIDHNDIEVISISNLFKQLKDTN